MKSLDPLRNVVRGWLSSLAKVLDKISGGHIRPNHITHLSVLGHILVVWAIIDERFVVAAVLLVVFGLMDSLDGALARYQKRVSDFGGMLDATADRVKEIILYSGIGYYLAEQKGAEAVPIIIIALGGSLMVSYVKAKGESTIMSHSPNMTYVEVNRIFQGGFLSYDIRMAILIVGLLTNQLFFAIIAIAILSWLTVNQRLYIISKRLFRHGKN